MQLLPVLVLGVPPQQVLLMSSLFVHSRAPIAWHSACASWSVTAPRSAMFVRFACPSLKQKEATHVLAFSFEQHFITMPRLFFGSRRSSADAHFS